MSIIISNRLDPCWNLAVEEYLLDHVEPYAPALFFWRSAPSVIIGKNQNPWRECNLPAMRRDGVNLGRRLSGGGAVYHDEGNLNYAFILRRTAYDEKRQFGVIRAALKTLGVDTEVRNRNSLFAGDFKISGNAFCFRKNSAMHHGTVLVESDLVRLSEYLVPGPHAIDTHAIASIPSKVINLKDLDVALSMKRVRDALAESFLEEYGGSVEPVQAEEGIGTREIEARLARYRSHDWVYGYTPAFHMTLSRRFPSGDVRLKLGVDKGRIRGVESNGLLDDEAAWVVNAFTGCRLHADDLERVLDAPDGPLRPEIRNWVASISFQVE